ncbi:MAG: hypothetical protein AB1Z98_35440 [Nannocystaceae bacterium]
MCERQPPDSNVVHPSIAKGPSRTTWALETSGRYGRRGSALSVVVVVGIVVVGIVVIVVVTVVVVAIVVVVIIVVVIGIVVVAIIVVVIVIAPARAVIAVIIVVLGVLTLLVVAVGVIVVIVVAHAFGAFTIAVGCAVVDGRVAAGEAEGQQRASAEQVGELANEKGRHA